MAKARTDSAHPILQSIFRTEEASAAPWSRLCRNARRCFMTRSSPLRANIGELRSIEKNLSGIVDPDEQHDQRTGRPVRRSNTSFAEVKPYQKLACGKQQ